MSGTSERAVLCEYTESGIVSEILNEDASGTGRKVYRLRGIFQKGDTVNRNKRIYPTAYLQREVMNLQESVLKRRLIGELDHPVDHENPTMKSASHVITKLEMRGSEVYGELEAIPGTAAGKDLIGLIESNIGIGISSRGAGSLIPVANGIMEVADDLFLRTFDIVYEPSVKEAYLTEAMQTNNRWKQDKKSMLYYMDSIL